MRSVCRVRSTAASVFVVAMHDRSAERRAEERGNRCAAELQATLESTADGILVTDLAGRVGAFNQRFALPGALTRNLLRSATTPCCAARCSPPSPTRRIYAERLDAIEGSALLQASDVFELLLGARARARRAQVQPRAPIGRVWSFRDITDRHRRQPAHRAARTPTR